MTTGNKNLLTLAVVAVLIVAFTATQRVTAATITPTDVAASSSVFNSVPARLIDSSGLTDVGGDGEDANDTHGTGTGVMCWFGGDGADGNDPTVVASEWLVFDLGSIMNVSGALVWNHNQTGWTHLGVEAMDISATATGTSVGDASGWAGTTTVGLAEGSGADTETAQSVAVSFSGVRFIRFDNFDNYAVVADSYSSSLGLNEVRFVSVSPATGTVFRFR